MFCRQQFDSLIFISDKPLIIQYLHNLVIFKLHCKISTTQNSFTINVNVCSFQFLLFANTVKLGYNEYQVTDQICSL
jgi:hypothetical protein